jgi:hypothetical protein
MTKKQEWFELSETIQKIIAKIHVGGKKYLYSQFSYQNEL